MRWTEEKLAEYQSRQGQAIAPPTVKGTNPTEDIEHAAVAGYLNALGLYWLHIANEGKRSAKQGARLKQLGMLPGAADIIIFDAPPLHPCAKGVCIEMKRQKNAKVSDEQRDFLDNMNRRGWLVSICHGANEAVDYLRRLGWR